MAGKHHTSSTARDRTLYTSPIFIFIISLLSLLFLIFFFSSSSSSSPSYLPSRSSIPNPNPNFEYSFVSSLEHFLTNKLPQLRRTATKVDTVTGAATGGESVTKLDDSMWKMENERLHEDSFYMASSMPIRVYIYEMPDKFTYDLLWLFRNSYKETDHLTSNGSLVHRLIEQATKAISHIGGL